MLKPPRFNAFYGVEDVKPVDPSTWKLELAGSIRDQARHGRPQEIYALPEQEMIIRHICVEGWDYIGQWSGVNFRRFLETVGADLTAKFVAFHCADGYVECIDMPTALHPQTMLATKYGREILTDPFGFPLRLRTATKLGLQEPQVGPGDRGVEHHHRDALRERGLQLVQRNLTMSDDESFLSSPGCQRRRAEVRRRAEARRLSRSAHEPPLPAEDPHRRAGRPASHRRRLRRPRHGDRRSCARPRKRSC